jgi:hypothetical protein
MVSSLTTDLPLFLPCLTERSVLARRYGIQNKMSAKVIPDKTSAKNFADPELLF